MGILCETFSEIFCKFEGLFPHHGGCSEIVPDVGFSAHQYVCPLKLLLVVCVGLCTSLLYPQPARPRREILQPSVESNLKSKLNLKKTLEDVRHKQRERKGSETASVPHLKRIGVETNRCSIRADPSTIQDKFMVGYQGW